LQRTWSSLRMNNFSINPEDTVFPCVKSFVNQTLIRIREFDLTWFVNRVFCDSETIVSLSCGSYKRWSGVTFPSDRYWVLPVIHFVHRAWKIWLIHSFLSLFLSIYFSDFWLVKWHINVHPIINFWEIMPVRKEVVELQ
jgi:hypothetical protein